VDYIYEQILCNESKDTVQQKTQMIFSKPKFSIMFCVKTYYETPPHSEFVNYKLNECNWYQVGCNPRLRSNVFLSDVPESYIWQSGRVWRICNKLRI